MGLERIIKQQKEKVMQALKTVFKAFVGLVGALWGRESDAEIAKDKEIEYERNQWGYWK